VNELVASPYAGTAARIRSWMLSVIAGEPEWVPPELVKKLRLVESVLPFLCRMLHISDIRSFADLLPEGDEEAGRLLELVHAWSAEMLAGSPAGAAPGGTPGADSQ
jgi:hypothetical protein